MSNGRFLCRLGPDRSDRVKGDAPLLHVTFPKLRGEGVGALKDLVNGLGNKDFDRAGVSMISNSLDEPACDKGEECTTEGLPLAGLTPVVIGLG